MLRPSKPIILGGHKFDICSSPMFKKGDIIDIDLVYVPQKWDIAIDMGTDGVCVGHVFFDGEQWRTLYDR